MQTGRYSFIKIFEATFITTRENFYGLLDDFNQEHTDYFINPLLRIKFSQAENLLIVNGYLVDKELVKDFGEISVLPISNDKISVRFNCFLSDYEWAIGYFESLKNHLVQMFGEDSVFIQFEMTETPVQQKIRKPYRMRVDVRDRIDKLCEHREDNRNSKTREITISKTRAYSHIGIDSRTVKEHNLELHERWNDKEYFSH